VKSLLKKDYKRRKIVEIFEMKRIRYKSIVTNLSLSPTLRNIIQTKLNKLPRQSSITQIKNRCILSGRGRGVYKFCKLSRILMRDLIGKSRLPGITKLSW
jgi:ribosomal protein S14